MNLTTAFNTVKNGGIFTHNLVYANTQDELKCYSVCLTSGRMFHFSDQTNFDANFKAFIIENSSKLVCEDTLLRAEVMGNTVYFDIIFK